MYFYLKIIRGEKTKLLVLLNGEFGHALAIISLQANSYKITRPSKVQYDFNVTMMVVHSLQFGQIKL